mmetsp:Transcript_13981/g.32566  ORF Transcript_13981/g.32566 Transcript_13981/m.32566 type:complete len:401 (+) Transcript_13981:334-1536(+)
MLRHIPRNRVIRPCGATHCWRDHSNPCPTYEAPPPSLEESRRLITTHVVVREGARLRRINHRGVHEVGLVVAVDHDALLRKVLVEHLIVRGVELHQLLLGRRQHAVVGPAVVGGRVHVLSRELLVDVLGTRHVGDGLDGDLSVVGVELERDNRVLRRLEVLHEVHDLVHVERAEDARVAAVRPHLGAACLARDRALELGVHPVIEGHVAGGHALRERKFLRAAVLVIVAVLLARARRVDPPRAAAVAAALDVEPTLVEGMVEVREGAVDRITEDRDEVELVVRVLAEGISIRIVDVAGNVLVGHLWAEVRAYDLVLGRRVRLGKVCAVGVRLDHALEGAVSPAGVRLVPVMVLLVVTSGETVHVVDRVLPERGGAALLAANNVESRGDLAVVAERRGKAL